LLLKELAEWLTRRLLLNSAPFSLRRAAGRTAANGFEDAKRPASVHLCDGIGMYRLGTVSLVTATAAVALAEGTSI
jgi:hypothetical protein